jgi:amino acid transporter
MTHRFRHKLRLFTLVAVLFSYAGGPFGLETMLPVSGPGMTLLLLVVIGPVVWALPMMLTVAELGAAVPVQGGSYRWARRALGDFWGFLAGWWQLLSTLLDQALYPVLLVTFVDEYFRLGISGYVVDVVGVPLLWLRWLLCVGVIASCALVNVRGVHWAGASAIGLNVLIVAPYLVFTALAVLQVRHNPFTPLVPPGESVLGALGFGLLVAMWNYSGYEAPSAAAEEIDNPQQTVPRGLFIAVPLEILIYAVPITAALMVRGDWMAWSEGSFVDIARSVGGILALDGGDLVADTRVLADLRFAVGAAVARARPATAGPPPGRVERPAAHHPPAHGARDRRTLGERQGSDRGRRPPCDRLWPPRHRERACGVRGGTVGMPAGVTEGTATTARARVDRELSAGVR